MSNGLQLLSISGIILILIGIVLFLIPFVIRAIPSLEILQRIPPIILYIYRSDGFFFATSPILIILGLIYLIWNLLR
ncbi:MAG: hypothetical protein RMJ31_00055 [Nitrososphaerota archaeon]|nr:hypothetical protein [Nitrososphaerales archaeon]MCX8191768.1 hypothetical protein [Nitrososphaerales archaeon]MDW8044157.1 hypothetical protein [Nitrososphaerota archaeon]